MVTYNVSVDIIYELADQRVLEHYGVPQDYGNFLDYPQVFDPYGNGEFTEEAAEIYERWLKYYKSMLEENSLSTKN